jgi:transketolase
MPHDKAVQLAINTIRTLSMDAVQAAKSGHPGTPMALAPLVYTIWNRVLRFDPQDPIWPNRDRFVLSKIHASMLLWSILDRTRVQAVDAEYSGMALSKLRSFGATFFLFSDDARLTIPIVTSRELSAGAARWM